MTDEIIIICPELTPGGGGVADYTLRVLERWPGTQTFRFILPAQAGPSSARPPNCTVTEVERDAHTLRTKLPTRGGKILLQYSAYGFDRFGYPRWLLRGLLDWRERSGGLLVIMLHEIWTFGAVLNKNYLIQQLHRRHLRKLISRADMVFTSTASQVEYLRALVPDRMVQVLPVGSNIRVLADTTRPREPGLSVLFGLAGARVAALRKLQPALSRLAAMKMIRQVITIGGGDGAEAERALLSQLQLVAGFEQRGAVPEAEVSTLLSRATFGISIQDVRSFSKSSTFMAYAAHGVNILSPSADPAAPEPLCWCTHPAELLEGVAADELKARAEKLRVWQEQTASWPHIAARFAEALQLEGSSTLR